MQPAALQRDDTNAATGGDGDESRPAVGGLVVAWRGSAR
jgi:hypothetical protein